MLVDQNLFYVFFIINRLYTRNRLYTIFSKYTENNSFTNTNCPSIQHVG
jgi:hypothetical protein